MAVEESEHTFMNVVSGERGQIRPLPMIAIAYIAIDNVGWLSIIAHDLRGWVFFILWCNGVARIRCFKYCGISFDNALRNTQRHIVMGRE